MIGKLYKKEKGWIVKYEDIIRLFPFTQYGSKELPLYPEDSVYCLDADNGQEVEFEIVKVFGSESFECAKLINSDKEQQKKYLIEIMEEDAKDGLYKNDYNIKTSFGKDCEICGEHIDVWSKPTCDDCLETLKEIILERKEQKKK
jgi:hypothetical protein